MGVAIRLGAPEDLDALERLYNGVCDHMAATVNYAGWKKGVYPARRDAEEGVRERALFLAEEKGEIWGSFILRTRQEAAYAGAKWRTELEDRYVRTIYTFTVHPQRRGQGVGHAMLAFAARYAARQGARALRLDVYERNLPAIRLYESAGFQYADTVSLGLEETGLDWFRLYEMRLEQNPAE